MLKTFEMPKPLQIYLKIQIKNRDLRTVDTAGEAEGGVVAYDALSSLIICWIFFGF